MFLPRVVGISQAMEWVATGRLFPAEEALAREIPDAYEGVQSFLEKRPARLHEGVE